MLQTSILSVIMVRGQGQPQGQRDPKVVGHTHQSQYISIQQAWYM